MGDLEILQSFLQGRVRVLVGEITTNGVDAIASGAHSTLLGGGGVDAALRDAGGPQTRAECRKHP